MNAESIQVSWNGATHPGKVRPNNEDSFLALALNNEEFFYLGKSGSAPLRHNDFIFAVADGMGGEKSGEYASRIAVDKITNILPHYFRVPQFFEQKKYEEAFRRVFDETHRALTYLGNSYPECSNMGCTLSLIWITASGVSYAHIGDSRIYYSDHEKLEQLSHDHTFVGYQYRTGTINERQARNHPRKNALQRALGAGQQIVNPQMDCMAGNEEGAFLLCSDGLVDGLWDKHIREILSSENHVISHGLPAEKLVSEAVEKSGQDNTTALVVELHKAHESRLVTSN